MPDTTYSDAVIKAAERRIAEQIEAFDRAQEEGRLAEVATAILPLTDQFAEAHRRLAATRCMGKNCEDAPEVVIQGLVPGLAFTKQPVWLCVKHLRQGEGAVDIFRWLTDGRVSANA